MSLINEALKKAERESEVDVAPEGAYPQKIFFAAGRPGGHRVLGLGLAVLLLGALAVAALQMPGVTERLMPFGGSPSISQATPRQPATSTPAQPSTTTVTGKSSSIPAVPPPAHVDHLIAEGRSALQNGDMEAARSAFTEAAGLDPTSSVAQNGLGLVEKRAGRLADAERHYLDAIRLDPNDAEAHNNLALVYGQQGDTDRELVEYSTALKLRQNYPEGHLNYAIALERLGRSAEAKVEYEKFLADPPPALSHLAEQVRTHISNLPSSPQTGVH
ncbi:MAG TPA: tetratricopeptide repeat protein [Nitrospiria bacterium]|nr:tetratricopeptide repeat protein [Nitrospiria bacterium]